MYYVALNKRVDIMCEVMAHNNKDLTYHWIFNTSHEIIDIQQSDIKVNGSVSLVSYIPRTSHDYGSLLCWADNHVGRQAEPCVFQLLPVTTPGNVGNCRVQNVGIRELEVSCQAGSDGGEDQIFLLSVISDDYSSNYTSDIPVFRVTGLLPGAVYNISIYSYNSVGHSDKVYIQARTIQEPIDQAIVDTQLLITPVLGAMIGVGAALGLVTLSIVMVMTCRGKNSNHSEGEREEKDCLAPDIIPSYTGNTDDESGFELYKQKNFSTLNNRSSCVKPSGETRHSNVFIVVRENISYVNSKVILDYSISGLPIFLLWSR